tara:strand:+ start:27990 stop:29843 length:1854 start_codon:yes stop_codon:yes gene_type:complete
MEISNQILSDIVVFNKYAKFIPEKGRRETFNEICDRYESMMIDKHPNVAKDIKKAISYVKERKILPSMRAMQFAGPAITKSESRIYNCAYLPIDDYRAFSEIMFLLLGGTGVGYSVQFKHVRNLPQIVKPMKSQKYVIGDSIEGWADAVRHLVGSYMGVRKTKPVFDFTDIRPKGSRLVTAGGKAPGPEPLKTCLYHLETLLNRKQTGDSLTPLEVHDMVCFIADAVLAGGIRRAALISLFSMDDEEMLTSKYGNWWELNPQRGRANNSAVIRRHRITHPEFKKFWKKIQESNSGEPGMYFTNNSDYGTNPCCEIALKPFQFCNLTEVNVSDIESQEDLELRCKYASLLGTLQASFTDFHYLRPIWKQTTEKDALIGVGMTGIGSGTVLKYDLKGAAHASNQANEYYSELLGINKAARVTTIKPSGTTSCVLGTSSGIHAWHNDYYIRRMQCTKDESLYKYLAKAHPELVADMELIPNSAVIEIPQKAPAGSILRHEESALDMLERVKRFNLDYVREGHRSGDNTNNVSATVSIKEDEWKAVGEWMWMNRETFNGLSILPYDGGTYTQAPFENISKTKYYNMINALTAIDLRKVKETDDNTTRSQEVACAGGSCEIV